MIWSVDILDKLHLNSLIHIWIGVFFSSILLLGGSTFFRPRSNLQRVILGTFTPNKWGEIFRMIVFLFCKVYNCNGPGHNHSNVREWSLDYIAELKLSILFCHSGSAIFWRIPESYQWSWRFRHKNLPEWHNWKVWRFRYKSLPEWHDKVVMRLWHTRL